MRYITIVSLSERLGVSERILRNLLADAGIRAESVGGPDALSYSR